MLFKKLLPCAALATALLLGGCAYQMQIEQGVQPTNVQIAQLKVGLTKDQVSYLLGTPNLTDPYHPDTWYYIYTNKENKKLLIQQQLSVHFNAAGLVDSYQTTPATTANS